MSEENKTKTDEVLVKSLGEQKISEIKHYGVPGMRWGKRAGGGSTSTAGAKPAKKKVADMSPSEKKAYVKKRNRNTLIALAAVAYGPKVMNLGVRALGSAALAAASRRGQAQAASTLLSIGANTVASLSKGADGVWRL